MSPVEAMVFTSVYSWIELRQFLVRQADYAYPCKEAMEANMFVRRRGSHIF
jgi:hypothetical protein